MYTLLNVCTEHLKNYIVSCLNFPGVSLVAQMVKRLPAMRETRVQSLVWEDPLEKEMETLQYSCLENPMDGRAW